jgi:hypothetical protein
MPMHHPFYRFVIIPLNFKVGYLTIALSCFDPRVS